MTVREQTELFEQQYLSKYASLSKNSRGRKVFREPCRLRTDFQRDRDKILHSKAFRRLKHKTQVFIIPEGDHYRTRLTHTLEVSQIARTIARALRLNEDLVEAIALGHDLGHTPFGHSGERILNEICPGGFRHYEQSLRVAEVLEGLNLTHEVLDGIVNHSGSNRASTLEGQIIKFADRIAYINHDIDDSIRGGILSTEDLPVDCIDILGSSHSDRINTLILAVVNSSMDKDEITMLPEINDAMMKLRQFMFDRVYMNPVAKSEEVKAKGILKSLYYHYIDNPGKLPADYMKGDIQQAARDYVASMTDRYAMHVYSDIFIPNHWNVL